ncbi:MAG: adenylyltransferase/cytidyltransferase family protein [Roseburia sp.]|nr:adenylyltransferase/cytidyltransferase family protein [Roseburia sp.]
MKAIFAGTFDPFTTGHRNVAERALSVFGALTIAVAADTGKKTASLSDRVKIAELSVPGLCGVEVVPFSGLLSDFVVASVNSGEKCVLVRGIRNTRDFEYERELCSVYRSLCGVDAAHFFTLPELMHVSSTTVRELAALGNIPNGYVVADAYSAVCDIYGGKTAAKR